MTECPPPPFPRRAPPCLNPCLSRRLRGSTPRPKRPESGSRSSNTSRLSVRPCEGGPASPANKMGAPRDVGQWRSSAGADGE